MLQQWADVTSLKRNEIFKDKLFISPWGRDPLIFPSTLTCLNHRAFIPVDRWSWLTTNGWLWAAQDSDSKGSPQGAAWSHHMLGFLLTNLCLRHHRAQGWTGGNPGQALYCVSSQDSTLEHLPWCHYVNKTSPGIRKKLHFFLISGFVKGKYIIAS